MLCSVFVISSLYRHKCDWPSIVYSVCFTINRSTCTMPHFSIAIQFTNCKRRTKTVFLFTSKTLLCILLRFCARENTIFHHYSFMCDICVCKGCQLQHSSFEMSDCCSRSSDCLMDECPMPKIARFPLHECKIQETNQPEANRGRIPANLLSVRIDPDKITLDCLQ